HSRLFTASKDDKELLSLCSYIQSRDDGALCLVFYEKEKPDGRKAGTKAIYAVAQPVDFLPVDDYGAAEFAFRQAALLGLGLSMQDARYLVERAGRDLYRLEAELEKLAVMGEDATRKEIDLYVSPDINSNVFRMMDSFEMGKADKGYEALRFLMQNGERAPAIIGALAARFRLILQVQELYAQKRGGQAYELMGKNFSARRAIDDRNKYSAAWLKETLFLLTELDHACKTGQVREAEGLEILLAKVYMAREEERHERR
ncbi:MAG: DNA polymerase III subunit delta, partial [Christensenellales bacterium]